METSGFTRRLSIVLPARASAFPRAHPECLPTIPTRRTLHSGRRAFPFNDYKAVPWDNVYMPGWQPMSAEESTIAETLQQAGLPYRIRR